MDYSFTRYNMAGFEEERYEALMGRVNSDTFLGRAAGTLLFVGYAPERTVNVLGEYSGINLTISLSYRQVPWNYWYRGTSGPAAEPARWDILEANGSRLFPATAFGAVL